jgi:hypothetical protein
MEYDRDKKIELWNKYIYNNNLEIYSSSKLLLLNCFFFLLISCLFHVRINYQLYETILTNKNKIKSKKRD